MRAAGERHAEKMLLSEVPSFHVGLGRLTAGRKADRVPQVQ